ncbi:hypothetical protein [Microcystis aeruginosa]|nr:hypothetical protein [Microcystis aeruginosa]
MKLLKMLIGTFLILPIFSVHAQVPSLPPIKQNSPNLGDLPNNPTQQRNWVCNQGDQRIAVAAKEVQGWKELIEKQGWQCGEGNADIPAQTLGFSCEPEQTIGILTVYWLNGSNGQQQLSQWREQLAAQQGMVCTINNVQLFDTQENIPNPSKP